MSPNQIAAFLIQLGRQLDALVHEYRDLGDAAAEAKRDAELAYAREYMRAEGTVEDRRQAAIQAAINERYTAELMDRKVAGCREAIRAARPHRGRPDPVGDDRDEMRLAGVDMKRRTPLKATRGLVRRKPLQSDQQLPARGRVARTWSSSTRSSAPGPTPAPKSASGAL